jgi:hypothetical protein
MPAPYLPNPIMGIVPNLSIEFNDSARALAELATQVIIPKPYTHNLEPLSTLTFQTPRPMIGAVYVIQNIKERKAYIGQSQNLIPRWSSELNQLQTGQHHNYALQNDWDRLGPSCFQWKIFKQSKPSLLQDAEYEAIQTALRKGITLYNINLNRDDGLDWR